MPENYHLTPVEYELMEILWKLGSGTVRDVMECLPKKRDLAYTSVSTILRILQQKKIVHAVKVGRKHCYQPLLNKDTYAQYSVSKILNNVFAGQSVAIVAHLVNQEKFCLDDINAMQKLLDEKKKELKKC